MQVKYVHEIKLLFDCYTIAQNYEYFTFFKYETNYSFLFLNIWKMKRSKAISILSLTKYFNFSVAHFPCFQHLIISKNVHLMLHQELECWNEKHVFVVQINVFKREEMCTKDVWTCSSLTCLLIYLTQL